MKELRVAGWGDLNEALFSDTWDPRIERFRSTFAYRGLDVASYPLVNRLAETIPDLETLDTLKAKNFDVAVFFEPPSIDHRIVSQFAYFSMLSDPFLSMDDWLERPQIAGHVTAVKIVIPASLKWEVRDKLDQSNITERVLMPGLDGLCAWLKRHYKPV